VKCSLASVVDPGAFPDVSALGFENHLNVFHSHKAGLPPTLAHGLSVFLNTSAVDENFRRFNGHTQVNATDLKRMQYPSRDTLIAIGEWAIAQAELTQPMIDAKLASLL
jgi:adenine-specific DNA-methyltransferase